MENMENVENTESVKGRTILFVSDSFPSMKFYIGHKLHQLKDGVFACVGEAEIEAMEKALLEMAPSSRSHIRRVDVQEAEAIAKAHMEGLISHAKRGTSTSVDTPTAGKEAQEISNMISAQQGLSEAEAHLAAQHPVEIDPNRDDMQPVEDVNVQDLQKVLDIAHRETDARLEQKTLLPAMETGNGQKPNSLVDRLKNLKE